MVRYTNKYGDSGYISDSPTRKELERKTIPQLLSICMARRYNRNPFKKALIDYIISLDKLSF